MGTPYVWPYYYPQQQPHPYFQYPPTAASSGFTHRPSRSVGGSPYGTPAVIPTLLPVLPTAPPLVTPVEQPALLHPGYTGTRSRRHSFDIAYVPVPATVPGPAPWPTVPASYYPPNYSPTWQLAPVGLPRPQLHNLINGEIVSQQLYINFAVADLAIKKRTGPGTYDITTLSSYDLEQPATIPQMTRICVVCEGLPQWPVDLQVIGTTLSPYRRRRAALPYLTLEDIVRAVHSSLHRKISHEEWGRLSASQEVDVARAYTRRFKSSGSEWAQQEQRAEGVKRVDFLLKNTWFKGFTWLEPENGVERVKLLLGPES